MRVFLNNSAGRALVLGFLLCAAAGVAQAKVSISPAFVDVDLKKERGAGRFQITNLSDVEERFRINIIHFYFNEAGELAEAPYDENSLAEWIKLNPREFTLGPKTKRVVRFMIQPNKKVKSGEYWAGIELESLNTGNVRGSGERSMNVRIVSTILVPVFGQVGDVDRDGKIESVELADDGEHQAVRTRVANVGNGRLMLTGKYFITDDATGETVATGGMGRGLIFRDGQRVFTQALEERLPAGNYSVRVGFSGSDLGTSIEQTVKVNAGDVQASR